MNRDYLNVGAAPLIINVAPTGAVADAVMNPHVPLKEPEILEDVIRCARAGASMIHLHVRDDHGKPSTDRERFHDLITAIRNRQEGSELIICASTSGRHGQTKEQRAATLDLAGAAKPDMASLTLSSLNFMNEASMNEPDTVRFLAGRMQERGIRPELEVFDLGMVNFAKRLIAEGLVSPPFYFNLLLGNIAGAQATLNDVAALVNQLPEGSLWSLGGLGKHQRTAAGLGCVMASGVRIGLEDNLWLNKDTQTPAINSQLVEWVAKMGCLYGRSIATAREVRQWLGLV